MRIYNECSTGKAAACDVCGERRYNQGEVIDYGRYIADRLVAEHRRKIDIAEFVRWQVAANLPDICPDANIQAAVERFAAWDGQRICSVCEEQLYESVKQLLTAELVNCRIGG